VNQISLKAGQVITVVVFGGAGSWSQGVELGTGKTGYFPSDYVQLIPKVAITQNSAPPPPPPVIMKPKAVEKISAKVLFDFNGSGPNEMSLKAGEIVEVIEKGPAGAWSKVYLASPIISCFDSNVLVTVTFIRVSKEHFQLIMCSL